MNVHVPQALYSWLKERAQRTQRSVEEELVEVLVGAVALEDDRIPTDVANELRSFDTMSDDALWQVARTSHLTPAAAAHLEELNLKRQREGLNAEEQQIAETLLHQYERALLVRAEAMARLKDRGHDISSLLTRTTT